MRRRANSFDGESARREIHHAPGAAHVKAGGVAHVAIEIEVAPAGLERAFEGVHDRSHFAMRLTILPGT